MVTSAIQEAGICIPQDGPIIVCYGGGVDSTAMLVAMKRAHIVPDEITFADVGGEKPDTYHHVRLMDSWLLENGFPTIKWCKKVPTDRVEYVDLEGNCTDNETLPSLAFGMKSCSIKWKQTPQDYYIKGCKTGPNKCDAHPLWVASQGSGIKPIKLIGYDAGPADLRRSKKLKSEDADFRYHYPLQDLGWDREDCIKAIVEEGLPVPIKSACFFCPASKKWELWWLAGAHPGLFERALVMEYGALTGHHSRFDEVEFGDSWENLIRSADRFPSSNTTVGLGRSFAWNQYARVHGIVDDTGAVVLDRDFCMSKAESLKGSDNALDKRSC